MFADHYVDAGEGCKPVGCRDRVSREGEEACAELTLADRLRSASQTRVGEAEWAVRCEVFGSIV